MEYMEFRHLKPHHDIASTAQKDTKKTHWNDAADKDPYADYYAKDIKNWKTFSLYLKDQIDTNHINKYAFYWTANYSKASRDGVPNNPSFLQPIYAPATGVGTTQDGVLKLLQDQNFQVKIGGKDMTLVDYLTSKLEALKTAEKWKK